MKKVTIYRTGSSLFLKRYNDVDYIVVCDTQKECREAVIHNRNRTIDNHYRVRNSLLRIFLGCYSNMFLKLVQGKHIPEVENFSIFDSDIKEKYLVELKHYYETLKTEDKRWYHILIAYYMYLNNSKELTGEQLESIQSVHDNGISEELKQEIGEYFQWE